MADRLTFADALSLPMTNDHKFLINFKVTQSVSSPEKNAIQMDINWWHFFRLKE